MPPALLRPLLLGIAWLAITTPVLAQRVYWEPNHGTLGIDKLEVLTLVFDQCAPTEDVALPPVDGLEFIGQSYQQELVNSALTVSLVYSVRAARRGQVVIPAFDVRTNRGTIAVGEVRYEVGDASVGNSGSSIGELIKSYIRPARTTVWAGEVVEIEYIILGARRYNWQITSLPEWKPAGLVLEPWDEGERVQAPVNGETQEGFRFRTRAMVLQAGTLRLDPIKQNVRVQTGERAGLFFGQPRYEAFTISSDQPELTVRPLPQPAPAGFTGLVGTFKLESKVVPQSAAVGAPITWTLTLRGTGNWPANPTLPPRQVAADFQVVQPQPRQEMDDQRLFSGSLTEDAVLVPTRPGSYTLGPIGFAYFDTKLGSYQPSNVEAVTVTIAPAAPAQPPGPSGASEATAPSRAGGGPAASGATELPADLTAPPPLPHDPLATGVSGWAPVHVSGLGWWLTVLLPPPLLWALLAWREMLRTSETRKRAAARAELLALLGTWQKSGNPPDEHALARWRTLTARMLGIHRATPTEQDLARVLSGAAGPATTVPAWVALWREAERALFAGHGAVPAEWMARALATARATRVRSAGRWHPLRRRYWSPHAGAWLVLALLLGPSLCAAEDAATRAYHEGDFTSAARGWEARLAHEPRDWAAHNNLALACAQRDDWSRAAAHWTAAFLLAPREPSIRANLRIALTRLDGIDPELRRLVDGSILERAVTMLSPGEWQRLTWLGAAGLAGGGVLLVLSLYRQPGHAWRIAGVSALVAGAAFALTGFAGNRLYGPLGRPGAGMVIAASALHSIPTDLVEQQQSSPISAGAVVTVGRPFLGWDRVDAAAGAAGWIRREEIVPFFRAPPPEAAGDAAPAASPAAPSGAQQPPGGAPGATRQSV